MKYKDCENCDVVLCPEDCFNNHPGSTVALDKLIKAKGVKAYIVKE